MRAGIQSLGFENIVELPHGSPFTLASGLTLCAYQHGFDDSALVLEADGKTFLNLNDSHVTGLSLRQILKRHGAIDFLLRSHAPAQGYPLCYDAEDPAELRFHRREKYINRFLSSIQIVKPRHAIPFASNVCHLHSETRPFNRDHITPLEISEKCREMLAAESPVVVMMPGDSWDSTNGFRLTSSEVYRDADGAVSRLAEQSRGKLEAFYGEEEGVRPDFQKFRNYILGFMGSLPWGIGLVFRPIIVFDQPESEHRYWVADFNERRVYESDELPAMTRSVIKVHPAVLMDAVSKDILFFVHISKRMRIWVPRGGMKDDFKFWGLLQLYETGYLPLRNMMTPRALKVLWLRRFEVIEVARSTLVPRRFEEKAVPKVY
jgi:UDP-MurNAc hydroxylase